MSRVSNAIKLLNFLSLKEIVPLQELSDRLEISERSVQRLRNELENAGYTIETTKGPGGGYRLAKNVSIHPLEFTSQQRKQLKHGLSILANQQGDNFGPAFLDALGTLSNQLDYSYWSVAPSFQTVRMNIDLDLYQRHMNLLEKAITEKKRIQIEYRKNYREERQYQFEPYSLVVVNNMWYVSGYDQDNRYLNLKISRMTKIVDLNENYRFDEETLKVRGISEFGYNINPISAIIIVENMDYISEYIWGDKQEIVWVNENTFRLEVTFANELAFRKFVLGGGSNMKVITPESERLWIAEEARKMLELYT